jgi:hypothetical protein
MHAHKDHVLQVHSELPEGPAHVGCGRCVIAAPDQLLGRGVKTLVLKTWTVDSLESRRLWTHATASSPSQRGAYRPSLCRERTRSPF